MRQIKGGTGKGARRGRIFLSLAAGLCLGLIPGPAARAQSSAWAGIDEAQARLVSATTAAGDSQTLQLGLQFRLAKDWKVYWRSPGDAGFPPRLDWSGSQNFSDAQISWPAPIRFSVLGFETIGYHDEVVLPISARVDKPGTAIGIALNVDYLACRDICVPVTAKLSLTVPAGPARDSEFAPLIAGYRAKVPDDGSESGLAIENALAVGSGLKPRLEIPAVSREKFLAPDVFVEGPAALRFGVPMVELSGDGHRARLLVPVTAVGGGEPKIAGERITMTLVDGGRAMEWTMTAGKGAALEPEESPPPPLGELIAVLGLALLGGLILNLMPCVLPVLSLKLLAVLEARGQERRVTRIGFLASTAGIIACFLGLALAAALAKGAGFAVGWGIQFQMPQFLIFMALLVTLFACNLWGIFEIRLPDFIAGAVARPVDARGVAGNFLTGVFATVLATPCTAPFLGTAVGFALARGTGEIFAVFAALGLGMALPYLAVAAMPGLVAWLPRPGPWMGKLKKFLALALAATAVWLLTVLAMESSAPAARLVALILVALVAALVVAGKFRVVRWVEFAAAAVLVALAFLVPPLVPKEEAPPAPQSGLWQPFDPASIPNFVAMGKVVLVDVTADWCLTCKVNELLVLDKPAFTHLVAEGAVIAMRADWTRRDDKIGAYLASFGRYGIPFNAVYGPGAPFGIVLPEILTRDAVANAIARAKAGGVQTGKPNPGKG